MHLSGMMIAQAGTSSVRGVHLCRGIPKDARAQVAGLYWDAFGPKLGRVMGPRPRALAFIDRVMSPDHVITALDPAGQVLGIVGWRDAQGAFVGGSYEDMRAIYGGAGAYWRAQVLAMISDELPSGTIAVDGLVVRPDAQGAGVGSTLIEALVREARLAGHDAVRLDVIEKNPRARALYQRLGFNVIGRADSRLTHAVFGFRICYTMSRDIREP